MKSAIYQLFLSWIVLLVLFLKRPCKMHSHIGFLLSSRSFIILYFIFRFDPFWVNFCEKCKICIYSFFFASGCSVVLAPLEKISLFHCTAFAPLPKISDYMDLFLDSVLFHWSICLFFHQSNSVLITVSKLGKVSPLTVLLQYSVGYSGISLLISTK